MKAMLLILIPGLSVFICGFVLPEIDASIKPLLSFPVSHTKQFFH